MNFNMVTKNKKEDTLADDLKDEEEIEDDDDDEDERAAEANLAKRRMFKFMIFIVGGMILLLLVLYIYSVLSNQTYTYTEIEQIMKRAAISYFRDYPDSLPKNENSIVQIDSSNLSAMEKMKPLSEYLPEGVSCTGTVNVEKIGDEYYYTPYLNCGESYETVELYKKVVESNPVVTTGYGLYSVSGMYVFRGELINNYVQLDNSLWRIVKITSNNNLVLVHAEGFSYSRAWDNRYNNDIRYSSGINDYSASRIKEYLQKIYEEKDPEQQKKKKTTALLSENDKARLVSFSLCVGKKSKTDETNNNSAECSELLSNQRIGILTLSDYLFASVDANCKSATTKSCRNYNYLRIPDSWWLVTASDADTASVYMVEGNGDVSVSYASNYALVRPVVYLSSRVLFLSGDGSEKDPYKVR